MIPTPHKHHAVLQAWVMGKTVEGQSPSTDKWHDAPNINNLEEGDNYLEPSPLHPDYDWWEWRIKL